MRIARSWKLLSRASARDQRSLQDHLLSQYLREELYALSPYYRRLLDDLGLDPRRLKGVDDLRRLPLTSEALVLEAGPELVLRPTPHAIREHWGFARKLALSLGGKRAARALQDAYRPALELGGPGASGTAFTRHDLDVLAELGARARDLLALDPGCRSVHALPAAPSLGRLISERWPAGGDGRTLRTTDADPAALLELLLRERPALLAGSSRTALDLCTLARERAATLPFLELLITAGDASELPRERVAQALESVAPRARLARAYGKPAMKLALLEPPQGPGEPAGEGFLVPLDLCIVEVIHPETLDPVDEGEPGELVFTTLCAHGSALLRYRTGDWAEQGLRAAAHGSPLTLPRVSSSLRPMDAPRSKDDELPPT